MSANGKPLEYEPKTSGSERTLPLTPALKSALQRAQHMQRLERLKLGPDYGEGAHAVSDEGGGPYHPDTISDYWRSLCTAAGVSAIRLHDARHTCGTLMHLQGEPIGIIAQWLGHADPAFTLRTYVHPNKDALKSAAAALQRVVTTP